MPVQPESADPVSGWVREVRQEAGLSQGDLAVAIGGMQQTGVSKMERGERRVTLREAVQIANACGATDAAWIELRRRVAA